MTTEHSRLGLYNRLGEVLGEAHARTMMDTFANLTTKEDLTRVDDRFDRLEDRFDRLEDRFDRLEDQFHQLGSEIRGFYKTTLVTMVASMTALTGIFAALLAAFR